NTTFSTTFKIDKEYSQRIPIGKPIANSTAYVVDKAGHPVPVGVSGELLAGGDGVSRGYLNNPELTAEKFINFHHSKLYRTGDLARWMADGNIEFIGRIDQQVKIRGFRIELEEIESELSKHDRVKEVVVIDRKEENGANSEKYLCAYIVLREACDMINLKNHLSGCLPDYMVPSYFIPIEKIPLTANGKVDRKALPLPFPGIENSEIYVAPADKIEEQMAALWSEILNIEKNKLSMNADFFELGGHSLKAMVLSNKIHKIFDVKIPLTDIFQLSTVRELTQYIREVGIKVGEEYTAIEPVEKKEYYVLSSAQKRLYILWQMNPENVVYNIPVLEYLDKVHKEKLAETFKLLIRRHESLRTSFLLIDEEPRQKVHEEVEFAIAYYDLSAFENIEKIVQDFIKPFDLSRAPLLRVGLIDTGEDKYVLMIDMHHIISDGTANEILIKEFMAIYGGNSSTVLSPLRLQYKDYSEWQYDDIECGHLTQQERYWLERLAGELPVLNLPYDYTRPEIQGFDGSGKSFSICGEGAAGLRALAVGQGATMYMVLLVVFDLLLSRLSGLEDIVVGSPVTGRSHADLQSIIGMFVNTLVLRNHPCAEKTIVAFLDEVKTGALEAFENQDYPFETLVEKVTVARDMGRNPVFDVVFALQNMTERGKAAASADVAYNFAGYESKTAKFDMTLFAVETKDGVAFTLEYCTRLFKEETIERFIGYFKNIITGIIKNPSQQIADIEMLAEAEKQQLLEEFNNTKSAYPNEQTIPELFAEQASKTPDSISVLPVQQVQPVRPVQLTYRQLNEQSNRLAALLSQKGVMTDSIVAIMSERTIEMIIGILGILKSGGAYLPIDPEYPKERIDYMLKDSGAQILLTANEIASYVFNFHHSAFSVHHSGQLAYIIYTSGSTGKPKGVMVEHRNVVRLVKNTNFVEFRENERLLQTGALEFDASTFEIWGSLLNGMSLGICRKDEILNPGKLKENITKYNISTMWLTSPLFNQLSGVDIEMFAGLKNLLVGGDVLSPYHINRVRERFPYLNIINGYGPTENTTFSTTFKIDKEYSQGIPIGKPIANSTAYVVDKSTHLVPVGVCGELLVGGDGVSRGYLNNPGLTAERFLNFQHSKLYRTCDLARWLEDGNIEFLGRIDQQVKIRGFRIELAEIEAELLKHNLVKETVVIDREDDAGEKYLCSYIVPEEEFELPVLKEFLIERLPNYMVPSYFMRLENIPLNPNGKVDRKALPEPVDKTGGDYDAPENEIEEKMAIIWSEVLGIEKSKLSVKANFFDLGGHSLKIMIMIAKIHKVLNVKLELVQIYKTPTIRGIASLIETIHWLNEPEPGIALEINQESEEIIL
ncbi:MAG TPA: amino acid adenylation domain-containing protein, partial [Candidatus Deferrimicrobium sp.]|nr:amino acid adenylation domain-containing protein [Candidatus Deferrimicrobium sp.]